MTQLCSIEFLQGYCQNNYTCFQGVCIQKNPQQIPYKILAIITIVFFCLFMIFPLIFRNKAIIAIHAFDISQFMFALKYVPYAKLNRRGFQSLSLRSFTSWTQGWKLFQQQPVGVLYFKDEQGPFNKIIRIVLMYTLVFAIVLLCICELLVYIIKISVNQKKLNTKRFFLNNVFNWLMISFYITVFDMGILINHVLALNDNYFQSSYKIGYFIISIFVIIIIGINLFLAFYLVNLRKCTTTQQGKINLPFHQYQNFFMYTLDYQVLDNKKQHVQIEQYPIPPKQFYNGNLRILSMFCKIALACIVTRLNYFYQATNNVSIYPVLTLFVIYRFIFYLIQPFKKTQKVVIFMIILLDIGYIAFFLCYIFIENAFIMYIFIGLVDFGYLVSGLAGFFLPVFSIIDPGLYQDEKNVLKFRDYQVEKILKEQRDKLQREKKKLESQLEFQKIQKQWQLQNLRQNLIKEKNQNQNNEKQKQKQEYERKLQEEKRQRQKLEARLREIQQMQKKNENELKELQIQKDNLQVYTIDKNKKILPQQYRIRQVQFLSKIKD